MNRLRVGLSLAAIVLIPAGAHLKFASGPTKTSIHFIDIAEKAGITAKNASGDPVHKKFLIEMNGSGIAFIDYNNDGYPDLFVVNGTRFENMQPGAAPTNHLYRNNGNGTFTDVTEKAGLTASGWGQGICAGDYDNDGWDDLFVTYYGRNRLFHHNRDGTFRELASVAGVAGEDGLWHSGCAFMTMIATAGWTCSCPLTLIRVPHSRMFLPPVRESSVNTRAFRLPVGRAGSRPTEITSFATTETAPLRM